MQYLVHSSGKVLDIHDKAYIIEATSEEMAHELAKDKFNEEFEVIDGNIYTKPYRRTYKAILAYVFMLIPIILSFVSWKVGHNTISIKPDYISCLYAILFYLAFIVRFKGAQRTVGSWVDITFCIFIVLLLSSFIQTILVTKTFNILGVKKIQINTNLLLPLALALSWLGLKAVSAVCIISIGLLSLFNISALSESMGAIWGPAYIICAVLGILIYLSIEPAFIEAVPYLKNSINHRLQYVRNDLQEAGSSAKNMVIKNKHKKEVQ